jgi:hypothetical protein
MVGKREVDLPPSHLAPILEIEAGVAERQTRRIQNPLLARVCGFKSLLRHPHLSSKTTISPTSWD